MSQLQLASAISSASVVLKETICERVARHEKRHIVDEQIVSHETVPIFLVVCPAGIDEGQNFA